MEKAKIEISEVSMGVYKMIAQWHNSDEEATTQNLASLSNEIVEYVLSEAFNQDINANNVGIEMGPDAQENMLKLFKESQKKEEENNKKGLFGFMNFMKK